MASDSALPPVIGAIADDRDGNALGTVTTVFLDDVTEQPTWVGLTDGLHASSDDVPVIAPIADADYADGRLRLGVPAEAVRAAPRVSQADRLSPDEEARLLAHYRGTPAVGAPQRTTTLPPVPPANGPTVGTAADSAMTRTEERLAVSTVVEPWTRAVLRIEEVTEEVLVPVTITRQQARIEYLPLSTTDSARTAGETAEPGVQRATSTSGWVTLYAEEPSVTLERRPVERVRLATGWATEETTVTQELRKEQVELTTTTTPHL
ncbi:YsnF/AvaK domain-containing protein [Modestobacter versicolor]|nr:YsnF/AvaK domain-containing protein [Modestobacter versicolor]MBB3677693.1 stress response protein YsnF [Modestobacter versicolor]